MVSKVKVSYLPGEFRVASRLTFREGRDVEKQCHTSGSELGNTNTGFPGKPDFFIGLNIPQATVFQVYVLNDAILSEICHLSTFRLNEGSCI